MSQNKITFAKSIGFKQELNRRVDDYFKSQNLSPQANTAIYIKTVVIFAWIISTWTWIVFFPSPAWIQLIACVILGCGISALSFNIAHEANHNGYSPRKQVNYWLGLSMDLISGGSSYLWKYDHNVLHHMYTNIVGYDGDIANNSFLRTAPSQERKSFHRFQHIYSWVLYGFMPFQWYLNDFYRMSTNHIFKTDCDRQMAPSPKTSDVIIFWITKAIWLSLIAGIPLAVGHSLIAVIIGVMVTYMTVGVTLSVVFQLAHLVDVADVIVPKVEEIKNEWAIHQIKTTVDFAPKNAFLNWYLGGLNYQVIHHLFPQICHIHYPQIAQIVKEVCDQFSLEYKVHPTVAEAIYSHYRFLKVLGAG